MGGEVKETSVKIEVDGYKLASDKEGPVLICKCCQRDRQRE